MRRGTAQREGLAPAADHQPWLALSAEIRGSALTRHLADGTATARAGFAAPAMHGQEVSYLDIDLVSHALPQGLDGIGQG